MSMTNKQAFDALLGNLKLVREHNRVLVTHMKRLLDESDKLLLGQGSSTLAELVKQGRELLVSDSKMVPFDPKELKKKIKEYDQV